MSGKIGSKIASRLAGVCLLAIVLLAGSWSAAIAEEPSPTPYIPGPQEVYLQYESGRRFVNVTITWFQSPYMGFSWGRVEAWNSEVWVNAEMWVPGPIYIPWGEGVTHLYYLATLQAGEYNFTFKVWDWPIKEVTFTFAPTDPPIDINGDGTIDIYDLARVGKAYGSQLGEPAYDPDADLNMDGHVNMRDLAVVGQCYGMSL